MSEEMVVLSLVPSAVGQQAPRSGASRDRTPTRWPDRPRPTDRSTAFAAIIAALCQTWRFDIPSSYDSISARLGSITRSRKRDPTCA